MNQHEPFSCLLTAPSGHGFHEKACLCQWGGPVNLLQSAADQREARSGSDHGPLSLISGGVSSEGEKSVKGGRGCRRSEPLTDFSPSVQSRPRERGPGVSGGLSPWRSMRQSLMRASARRPSCVPRFSAGLSIAPKLLSARLPFTPEVSPRFHPHSS